MRVVLYGMVAAYWLLKDPTRACASMFLASAVGWELGKVIRETFGL